VGLVGGFAANQSPSLKMKKACHSERSEESKYFYRTTVNIFILSSK